MTASLTLKDYPRNMVRFMCKKCGRMGQYSKQHLLWRYGPEVAELGAKLANCERERGGCGLQYVNLKK